MGFLPLSDPLGIFLVPEIIFVSGFCQPGLLAVRLGTETLTFPMPVIRQKMFLAVKALTGPLLSLHQFKSQTNQSQKNVGRKGRKSR
jgi:hypothetical protein